MRDIEFDHLNIADLRRRTGIKWSTVPSSVLPAWVAEMDFPIATPIQLALHQAIESSDCGYPLEGNPLTRQLIETFVQKAKIAQWHVDPNRVDLVSDVVQGLYLCAQLFDQERGVVIQPPVYPPFFAAARDMRKRLLEVPLFDADSGYELAMDQLKKLVGEQAGAYFLCNPQNPTGRSFRKHELESLAELACKNDWLVIADEIHGDLVYSPHQHIPFASLGPDIARRTITLTSASKTFNIPGLKCAVIVFGSEHLHKKFKEIPAALRGRVNSLGQVATVAAWQHGESWANRLRSYLDDNRHYLATTLAQKCPELRWHLPEATYLAWCDFSAWNVDDPQIFLRENGHVELSQGTAFGKDFKHYARLNFGTSREILAEIIDRILQARQRL